MNIWPYFMKIFYIMQVIPKHSLTLLQLYTAIYTVFSLIHPCSCIFNHNLQKSLHELLVRLLKIKTESLKRSRWMVNTGEVHRQRGTVVTSRHSPIAHERHFTGYYSLNEKLSFIKGVCTSRVFDNYIILYSIIRSLSVKLLFCFCYVWVNNLRALQRELFSTAYLQ